MESELPGRIEVGRFKRGGTGNPIVFCQFKGARSAALDRAYVLVS